MPMRPARICRCGQRIASGERCPCQRQSDRERKARHDAHRPSARQRGYDSKWQKAREEFLSLPENQLCACGCGRKADTVDHVIPHRGDMKLFWDRKNWQALNHKCHSSRKQRIEAGGGFKLSEASRGPAGGPQRKIGSI